MEVVYVKHWGDQTTVVYQAPNGKHTNAGGHVTDCPDPPRPSFIEAMKAVEGDLVELANVAGFGEAFTLTGVHVSKTAQGHRQFKFDGMFTVAWGSFGVSLPLVRARVSEEGGPSILADTTFKKVENWLREAQKYADQDRIQGELALGGTTSAEQPAGAAAE